MARRTRTRVRRPRTRRQRMRRPITSKKSRGKIRRRRTRRPRMSKRFFMRGGDKTTNIKILNTTKDAVFLIGGLDKAGSGPGSEPIEGRRKVEPQKYLTVQNPEGNHQIALTINDNGGNEIFKFELNTGENCLVIISDDSNDSNDLTELKSKLLGLNGEGILVPLTDTPINTYRIHKALAGPENGGTSSGKMDYNYMKSTTLNDAGFSSQL